MRLFILSNQYIEKNEILKKLEEYIHRTSYINYIWSINGLIEIENNKVYSVDIVDVPVIKTMFGAYPLTIDNSKYVRCEETYQTYPRSIKEYIFQQRFRFSHDSKVEWVVEYKDNEIYDNYFYIKEDDVKCIHTEPIKSELTRFLSM
jgi:hypothetical protein